jgi:hypothetical protein
MGADPIEIVRTLLEGTSQGPRHSCSATVDVNDGVARILLVSFGNTRFQNHQRNRIARQYDRNDLVFVYKWW